MSVCISPIISKLPTVPSHPCHAYIHCSPHSTTTRAGVPHPNLRATTPKLMIHAKHASLTFPTPILKREDEINAPVAGARRR